MSVESFAALMTAIEMVAIGIGIFYNSYQSLMHPHEVIKKVVANFMILVFSPIKLSNLMNYELWIMIRNDK